MKIGKFNTLLRKSLAERIERRLLQEGKRMSIPMALHAQLQASALVIMITWWLENDCPYTPAEMIKNIYEHIDLSLFIRFSLPPEPGPSTPLAPSFVSSPNASGTTPP